MMTRWNETAVEQSSRGMMMTDEKTTTNEPRPRKSGRGRPIHVAIDGGDEAQRATLRGVLSAIDELAIEFIDVAALNAGKDPARSPILMMLLDASNPDGWRHDVRMRIHNEQFASVIVLISEDSPAAMRAALRAGADDVLTMPPTPAQALHCLLRMSELKRRFDGVRDKTICSLVSVSGGVGVSYLAVNLALAFHRLFQKRTAIVELDLQAAPLAVLLNLEPEHTISELADPTSLIDSIRLESVLCKHESGLYWLAAPKRIEEAELVSAATVEATLKVLRELFDVVVIDCGTHMTESSIVAWERSDHLLYLVDQTVTAIRAAQRFLDLYRRLGLKDVEPSIVLNRYTATNPITPERIETALRKPLLARLPRDDKSCGEQQITGQDLWQIPTAATLRENVEALARKLYSVEDAEPIAPPQGLIGRLLTGLGLHAGVKNGTA